MLGWKHRAVDVFFVLSAVELVLGVNGHLIEIGNGLTLRIVIFIIAIALTLTHFTAKGYLYIGAYSSLLAITAVLTFLQGTAIGLINGNRVGYIIGDANAFLYPLFGIGAYHWALRNGWSSQSIVRLVLLLVITLALTIDSVYGAIALGVLDAGRLARAFEAIFKNELVISPPPRLVFLNMIYIMIAAVIVFSRMLVSGSLKLSDGCTLSVLIVCLIASHSRAFHLGFFLGCLSAGLIVGRTMPWATRRVATIFVVGLGALFMIAVHRDFSDRLISDQIRVDQVPVLWDKFEKSPLWGHGFGATVENLVRSVRHPYSFEIVPLDFLIKLGIIGSTVWLMLFGALCSAFIKRVSAIPRENVVERGLAIGGAGGLCAFFIACLTNPYFNSSVGMGAMIFFCVILDLMVKRTMVLRITGVEMGTWPKLVFESGKA